jgi:hypothetical protein
MLYREIIAVCSEIHIKHINTLCGQNVELWMINLVVHIMTTGLYRVNSQLYYRTNIYIYLTYCRNKRTGRWRGHVNVRRASNRRTEWQSAHRGYVICTPLPSTQNSAPCITTERWTRPSGTPQCTTHLNKIIAHDPTALHTPAELPRAGVGHCRTARNGALLRQPTAPRLIDDLSAFYRSRRLSLPSARLIQSRPSILFLYGYSGMLQWTMIQRTRRNTIGRRSTRVRMTCRAFPLRLQRQSSSLLGKVCSVFSKERLFVLFKFTCTVHKS